MGKIHGKNKVRKPGGKNKPHIVKKTKQISENMRPVKPAMKMPNIGNKFKQKIKEKLENLDSSKDNMKFPKSKSKADISSMSVDEFLNSAFTEDFDIDSNASDPEIENGSESGNDSTKLTATDKAWVGEQASTENDSESEDGDELDDEFSSHKASLSKLKETDPEFYSFLQENDKRLLNFNVSDSDEENEEEDDQEVADVDIHEAGDHLEVASDESDFEPEGDAHKPAHTKKKADKGKVTLQMLKQWQGDLKTDKSSQTLGYVVKAFHAAMLRVSSEEEQREHCDFIVDGSAVFNGVVQLCVLELQPAIKKFLRIAPGSKQPPHKCKRFVKIKTILKCYLTDLLKLLKSVTSSNILNVLLKHLHHMSPIVVSYANITKPLLRKLIKIWGTKEDSVRVIAFLCILRITNNQRVTYLDFVLKKMYMTYVVNSKFVSPGSLPSINFMRRSLVELYGLDLAHSYQHVFLYVRQLAIHLRNAITLKKKEHIQAVYNWQYINSIHLWAELLAGTCNNEQLQPLIYPLVQICIGTLKLIPTPQYFPLRFHCIDILVELSRDSGVYIPILPYLYEILSSYDFNKKHKKASLKPLQFTCMLRLSKSQLSENGFKDAVIENLYACILQYLATQSNSIAFPDLVVPLIFELKKFLKSCSVANYCKKMKQLLEKIDENSKFIDAERRSFTYNLCDQKQISGWEINIRNKGTPLVKYYTSWEQTNSLHKKKAATKNDELADYSLPTLKRTKRSADDKKDDGPVELFPSDSEDDATTLESMPKRRKRGSKKNKLEALKVARSQEVDTGDDPDVILDSKLSDW